MWRGTTNAPEADDPDGLFLAGVTFNAFMVTQDNGARARILWAPEAPFWQTLLLTADTTVASIGARPQHPFAWRHVDGHREGGAGEGIEVTLQMCHHE